MVYRLLCRATGLLRIAAALRTGCYPNRTGILGALSPYSKEGIHPDELTLAEVLKT